MSKHQYDQNANKLWLYFRAVIEWVENTFTKYRKEIKDVDQGKLYNLHGKDSLNTDELEAEISRLMQDEDVTNKKGICPACRQHFEIEEIEADHIML